MDQPIELIGERTAQISNGSLYTGHPHVGRLIIGTSGLCTATLIGNTTVVTAAHCIKSGSTHTFILDSGEQIAASSTHVHPQYQGEGSSYDIAVVRLSKQPANVAPGVVATSAPAVGTAITLIGYGVTMCNSVGQCNNDANVKRRTTNSISKLYQVEFRFDGGQSTCKGDSGGPAFATLGGREVQ
ncbi:MAG: trypsin-like serine protease, partial [Myxococcales bacterium]|nr:trypsin-like serine protease [Myxococcales bacterium]